MRKQARVYLKDNTMKPLVIATFIFTLFVFQIYADSPKEEKSDSIHRFRQYSLEECSFLMNTRLELLEKSPDLSSERKAATKFSMYQRLFLTWLQLRAIDAKLNDSSPYDYACKRLKKSIINNINNLKLSTEQLSNPMNEPNLDKPDNAEWKSTSPDRLFAFYPPPTIANTGEYKQMIKDFREWCEK